VLETLRRERVELRSLRQVFDDLETGRPWRRPVVAFTIDDGYLDQAAAGAPAFAAYDCPVTTFVTSGFLDGRLWFWWDRIAYVFGNTRRSALRVVVGDEVHEYVWRDGRERLAAQTRFTELCKVVPEPVKLRAIEAVAEVAEVTLPEAPPSAYAPMTWDDLRRCEAGGMEFGPHTVTHPVLSRTDDAQSAHEVAESWSRVRAEAHSAVPIFCYPNGQRTDFGPRELATFRTIGIRGAVVGETGYASHAGYRAGEDGRFQVPRFAYHESVPEMRQLVNGVERFKELVKGVR
jgi:peptidoglycan/xylan/chitin deacetylase (PgdA/CDA1 family)